MNSEYQSPHPDPHNHEPHLVDILISFPWHEGKKVYTNCLGHIMKMVDQTLFDRKLKISS